MTKASEHPLQEAPEHATFQSYQNTEASSELPASGNIPLPTQEGKESDFLELKENQSAGRAHSLPTSISSEKLENSAGSFSATPLPSSSTSTPEEESQHPVLGTLSSRAKEENHSSHSSMIRGSISNKGKSSAAAASTPIGRYKKALADAISSHWYHCIDARMELLSFGTAIIFFYVNEEGKIEEPRLISNTSNQTFADCCFQSIMEATIPIIPAQIAKTLEKGRLEIEYRFTIYPD